MRENPGVEEVAHYGSVLRLATRGDADPGTLARATLQGTGIELAVLVVGWLLGGTVGVGTVAYALCIGPLAHVFIPLFSRGRPAPEGALEAV